MHFRQISAKTQPKNLKLVHYLFLVCARQHSIEGPGAPLRNALVQRYIFDIFSYIQDIEEECINNLCGNGFNRWFDKSLTVCIYENGLTGGNVEHTTADATVTKCY